MGELVNDQSKID